MTSATTTRAGQKERRLSIRASDAEKALLLRAAQARSVNTSQFVLQASLDAAQAVLADQTQFRLPPEEWAQFAARLDEPPRVIPALQALFGEPEPYDAPA